MRTSLLYFLVPLLLVTSLTGCWDRREINDLGIVSAAGFDIEGEDIVVTVELFRPPIAGQMGAIGTREPVTRSSVIAVGRGPTVLWAVRDLARKVPRRIYWAQAVVVIVGEEFAKRGVDEVLDFWDREAEPRRTALFLVAKGRASDVVIEPQGSLETTLAEEVNGLENTSKWSGYTFVSTVHEVVSGFRSDSRSATTGVIETVSTRQPPVPRSPMPGEDEQPVRPADLRMAQLTGIALFTRGKLVTTIPISPASRGISAATRKLNSTALNVPCPCTELTRRGRQDNEGEEKDGHMVELKVTGLELHTNFLGKVPSPQADSEDPFVLQFKITARIRMSLSSQGCSADLTRPELTQKIQKQAADAMARELQEAVDTSKETSCDFFGFARALHIADPESFREVKDRWPEALNKIEVVIDTGALLEKPGNIRRRPAG